MSKMLSGSINLTKIDKTKIVSTNKEGKARSKWLTFLKHNNWFG